MASNDSPHRFSSCLLFSFSSPYFYLIPSHFPNLTLSKKVFLKAFIEVTHHIMHPTWKDVCTRAGVVSEKSYLKRLVDLKLLLSHPNGGTMRNPGVQKDMLDIPIVRNISKSMRFDIFQRDNYTCQYCGRTPPEAILVIDHLTPVAENGTDDFDNLITSCKDCNDGKSDKLILNFTGGISKEEWRERLRGKRIQMLQQRQERLEEVAYHWRKITGQNYLTEDDNRAIQTFAEIYEPDWIKAAIEIAVRKKAADHIRYTAAILRNWAKNGPPDYITRLTTRE
jgi:hypothetical protein